MRIKMSIVEFETKRIHNGRRGSPRIPIGTKLYAIKYEYAKGGYFTYSYESKQEAQEVIDEMISHDTDTDKYWEWNVVFDVDATMHVAAGVTK